jgi:plasmid stabilization system protein ParE
MIPRRRGIRTQKGNPHRLTREQHVIPVATLRRFALQDGRIEVHLRDGRMAKLSIDNQLFCVERLWDQRAEAGYMKKIEDEFQALVNELEAGRLRPLSPAEHRCVTRFWGLWHWRNHFIDSPLKDIQLNGIAGESLTLDQREILESRWYAFAVGEGKPPARVMTGLHIQMAIDRYEMANGGKRWGVLRSPALPLVLGDRPGNLMSLPASPRLLLAANNPDGELKEMEAFRANQVALALSRNFAVIGRFYK